MQCCVLRSLTAHIQSLIICWLRRESSDCIELVMKFINSHWLLGSACWIPRWIDLAVFSRLSSSPFHVCFLSYYSDKLNTLAVLICEREGDKKNVIVRAREADSWIWGTWEMCAERKLLRNILSHISSSAIKRRQASTHFTTMKYEKFNNMMAIITFFFACSTNPTDEVKWKVIKYEHFSITQMRVGLATKILSSSRHLSLSLTVVAQLHILRLLALWQHCIQKPLKKCTLNRAIKILLEFNF